MKQLSKLGISAGLAVVAVLTLSVLLDTSASAGEDGTAGTVPVDTFNVCRPDGDGTFTFVNDVTEALTGDLVDGVDGTFKNQNHCDALAEPPANDPPANDPPANDPPANDPPANDPPANDPPANDPPADTGGGGGDTDNGGDTGTGGGTNGGDTGGNAGGTTQGAAATTASEGEGDGGVVIQQGPGDVIVDTDATDCEEFDEGLITLVKFDGIGGGFVVGDTFSGAGVTVEVTAVNSEGEILAFDWTSETPIDVVLVKAGGGGGNIGTPSFYDEATSGSETTGGQGLSHVTFCFDEEEEPDGATIQICKADIPGVEQEFNFTSTIPGAATFSIVDGDCETTFEIDPEDLPATFTVTETEPAGFSLLDIDCGDADVEVTDNTVSISVDEGDAVVCTFENEADETVDTGEITICKETIPDEDPEETLFDFETDFGDFDLLDDQCEDSGELDAGVTYDADEVDIPDGFTLINIECVGDDESVIVFQPSGESTFQAGDTGVSIDLAAGEHVTCTFTNESEEVGGTGIIEICKEVLAGSDTSQSFTFSGDITIAALMDGECDAESGLDPGEFDVTENVPANWDLVDVVCEAEGESTDSPITNGVTIDLAEGDLVRCTFFNVEEDTPPPPPGDDDDADDDDSDVGGVRQPRVSQVGGVRSPGKPGVGTGDGSFEPFTSFKDSADATSTWLPALGFLAAMGLAGMAVAHVQRRNGR